MMWIVGPILPRCYQPRYVPREISVAEPLALYMGLLGSPEHHIMMQHAHKMVGKVVALCEKVATEPPCCIQIPCTCRT